MECQSNFYRWILLTAAFVIIQHNTYSQSRLYVTAGLTGSSGGPYYLFKDYKKRFGYEYVGIEWEERIVGSLYLLTGLSYYGMGYTSEDRFFGSAIEFRGSYVSLPLLARWNIKNWNTLYLDLGLSPSYLVHAHLEESIMKWDYPKSVVGDVTPHLNRLYIYSQLQGTIAIKRFLITGFIMLPFEGQITVKDLEENWGLNKQESTYLLNSDYLGRVYGFKIGFRVK
ncbi:hypothetical protein ACFLU5_08700 [Bacteroidota bacterium]